MQGIVFTLLRVFKRLQSLLFQLYKICIEVALTCYDFWRDDSEIHIYGIISVRNLDTVGSDNTVKPIIATECNGQIFIIIEQRPVCSIINFYLGGTRGIGVVKVPGVRQSQSWIRVSQDSEVDTSSKHEVE